MKILIADDSDIVRRRLIEAFYRPGGTDGIIEARSVGEAVERVKHEDMDLAILDIQMPGGSGIDVLHYIKKKGLKTVVIMYTSYAFPQYRERCFAEGADYFFDKTTESRELIGTILKIISHAITETCKDGV